MKDIIITCLTTLYLIIVITLPLLLYYKKLIKKDSARKIIHLFSGLSILSILYINNKLYPLILSTIMTLLLYTTGNKTPILKYLFKAIAEKSEKKRLEGPIFYAVSLTLLIAFSIITNNTTIPIASALVLIISDPIASIIGQKYGTHKIYISYTRTIRSLEGSTALFISNLIIISLFYSFSLQSIIISLLIAVVELVSVSKSDDLTLPLSTAILLLTYH